LNREDEPGRRGGEYEGERGAYRGGWEGGIPIYLALGFAKAVCASRILKAVIH